MSTLTAWVGRHQSAAAWMSGGIAAVLLFVGTAIGASRASNPRTTSPDGLFQAQPVAAKVPASRHSVVGVVRAVGPSEILVRNQRGVFFAIRWGPSARFRSGGREVRSAAVRPGDRVVVIGNPAPDGSLVASFVTVIAAPPGEQPTGLAN